MKIDMVGKKFGRWTVIKENGRNKSRTMLYKCECECGAQKTVNGASLRTGASKSCGCLSAEMSKKRFTTHGMKRTPTYMCWEGIIQRCTNSNSIGYKNYGGRGIKVCKRWMRFKNFFADMGIKPKGLTIERQNNEEGYYNENCYWATYIEQGRNQRTRKDNSTGIRGAFWSKENKKYRVQITVNKKCKHIGYFVDLGQAAFARKQAEGKYWGKVINE